jgi:hypothetical protein
MEHNLFSLIISLSAAAAAADLTWVAVAAQADSLTEQQCLLQGRHTTLL